MYIKYGLAEVCIISCEFCGILSDDRWSKDGEIHCLRLEEVALHFARIFEQQNSYKFLQGGGIHGNQLNVFVHA